MPATPTMCSSVRSVGLPLSKTKSIQTRQSKTGSLADFWNALSTVGRRSRDKDRDQIVCASAANAAVASKNDTRFGMFMQFEFQSVPQFVYTLLLPCFTIVV